MEQVNYKELGLEYRENEYFNENDTFIFYDYGINKIRETKVELYNGYYFCIPNTGGEKSAKLSIKMTSVLAKIK